jgi:hypothetical protein
MGGARHPLDEMRAGHHAMIKQIRTMRIPVVARFTATLAT